ncbi:hypothetical protein ACEQPO_04510 [Bacillus sp. SL00103]
MAILVKDALSLDIMKGTKLLAGENGLDRLIEGDHRGNHRRHVKAFRRRIARHNRIRTF